MLATSDPGEDIRAYGTSFYQKLLQKSDATLSADHFSKKKVEEGLARLDRMGS
jgi:hypothetical protein